MHTLEEEVKGESSKIKKQVLKYELSCLPWFILPLSTRSLRWLTQRQGGAFFI